MAYRQRIPRKKVIEMMARGYRVVYDVVEQLEQRQVFDSDLLNIEPYQNKIGYTLIDPDGYPISPEPRQYASQAWDDILL